MRSLMQLRAFRPRPRPVGLGRGFMLHFYTCSARTARFGLLYRNILFNRSGRQSNNLKVKKRENDGSYL